MFKYWVYKFGQFCVNHLPLTMSYRLAEWLSDIQYLFSFRDRRAVRANLRQVVKGSQPIEPLVRDVFRNFGRYLVEFFWMARHLDEGFIHEKVRLHNIEAIKQVQDKGRGAIFLTAHIGNWELGGVVLSRIGYASLAIALSHKERPVNNLFNQQRERQGIRVVPLHLSIRKCLETLNRNEFVAILGDRNFTPNGEVLDFLGRRVFFPKGPALFSLRTGAPIIPIFFMRVGKDRFDLFIDEPIYPPAGDGPDTPPEAERQKALMGQYVARIEHMIRRYPGQWLMFRRFWIKNNEKSSGS